MGHLKREALANHDDQFSLYFLSICGEESEEGERSARGGMEGQAARAGRGLIVRANARRG